MDNFGHFLLEFVSDYDPKGKFSPPVRTYTHEDFRPTPQNYFAPQPEYRPIEFPKAEPLPMLDSLPKTQVPLLNAPTLFEQNLVDDKPSLDLSETLDSLESDAVRKKFEVDMDSAVKLPSKPTATGGNAKLKIRETNQSALNQNQFRRLRNSLGFQ